MGRPKLILHDLAALLATFPVNEGRPWRRILSLMRFDHIGGLDMAWRALGGSQVLVAPPQEITPEAVATTILRLQVEVLLATPNFLSLLLNSEAHRSRELRSLRIVSYGAAPVQASLLERLRSALPRVEFVPCFGTSESSAFPVPSFGEGVALSNEGG